MGNPNPLNNLGGKKGPPFSATNQPSAESKRKGWAKRKAGKELAAACMELLFKGAAKSDLKRNMRKYFGLQAGDDITVEMMLHFRQIEKAVQKGDTAAYRAVMERAHGMPKQEIDQNNFESGELKITRTVISKKV